MNPAADRPLPASLVGIELNEAEKALLQRIIARDRAAFEALYHRYFGRLQRFLSRFTRRGDVAEEAINDTFWIVWQKAGEFRGQSLVSTWIMGIAYRCMLKALRRNGAEPVESSFEEERASDYDRADDQREQSDWLTEGLRRLPTDQSVTLKLAYYLGHSLEEIAEIMECPTSTVKARMFHARVKLRNLLPGLGGMDERRAP